MSSDFTLAELMIAAASEAWRENGEVLASGIGVGPRLAASLAKLTHSPELLLTDGEAFLVEEPVPLGPRGEYEPKHSGYMPFARVFDCVWGGRRHAMLGPVQIDRWGQMNLSAIGERSRPKIQMLGMRGLPGNTINHACSMFIGQHSRRVFVSGEVDVVGGVGYNAGRWQPQMRRDHIDLRLIVTDLCVLDFRGEEHAARVRSLHEGVSFEDAQAVTGFPLTAAPELAITPAPTLRQLEIIRKLDPHELRAGVIKGNPLPRAPIRPRV